MDDQKFEELEYMVTRICSRRKNLKVAFIPDDKSKIELEIFEEDERTTVESLLELGKVKECFEVGTTVMESRSGKTILFKLDDED